HGQHRHDKQEEHRSLEEDMHQGRGSVEEQEGGKRVAHEQQKDGNNDVGNRRRKQRLGFLAQQCQEDAHAVASVRVSCRNSVSRSARSGRISCTPKPCATSAATRDSATCTPCPCTRYSAHSPLAIPTTVTSVTSGTARRQACTPAWGRPRMVRRNRGAASCPPSACTPHSRPCSRIATRCPIFSISLRLCEGTRL